jgi:hypothetical protein
MTFYIPVKLDTPERETLLRRCYTSIRRIYPEASITLLLSMDSLPLTMEYDATIRTNTGFSVVGALQAYLDEQSTDYAYILHDSMVVTHELPIPKSHILPIFHFDDMLDCGRYDTCYQDTLQSNYIEFRQTYTQGILGCSFVIQKGVRLTLPNITTKYQLEALERMLPYYISKQGYTLQPSLCGSIFDYNPWDNPQWTTDPLESFLSSPIPVVKTLAFRL